MLPKYSDTTVNGKSIRIKLLPALTVGIPTARRLLNIIAPAVGGTLDGLRHDDFIHGAPKTFSEMALVVCKQLEEAEVHQIMFTLLEHMEVNNKVVNLDEYFMGNYGEMIEILEFALRENFQSFFTGNGMKERFHKVVGMIMSGQTQEESSQE
ncbi:tail assembly chaperone [Alteromonas phage vB_AmeM_PT11-V22]|uniref:Tape measure chaperone n=1 Tax=Alteromonas phage vB_AmeM_PT11-V22 TaxID=2704031 RepID=A0A6C0R0Q7_9CAUD|nr:tail assembly chaperone [Alteromonas phage vB_AmeM_PT11-V22]QHZ59738.1 tape measure chaperone [Alteromonas phage vB_AmeM_PT11-V22]